MTWTLPLIVGFTLAGLGVEKQSQPTVEIRVLNAIADKQMLTIGIADKEFTGIPYGNRTQYLTVPANQRRVSVIVNEATGERLSNEVMVPVQPGFRYTLVLTGFVAATGNFTPIVIRDTTAGRPSTSSTQFMFLNAMSDQTPVSFTMNGEKLTRSPILTAGNFTNYIGYGPREYAIAIESPQTGQTLFTMNFKAIAGNRYTVVAMGANGQMGNRAPRVFVYSF